MKKEITINKSIISGIIKGIGIFSGISLALSGLAYAKLYYSTKKTKVLCENVWNDIKEDIRKDLGLNKTPTVEYDANGTNALMYVSAVTHYTGTPFSKVITQQDTDYVIHVNVEDISQHITKLNANCVKDISVSFVKTLFRHECRHLHQFQNGFNVGKRCSTLAFDTSFIDGYGADRAETDANIYAISAAQNKEEKIVAELNKALQDNAGKICPDGTEIRACIQQLTPFQKLREKLSK